MENVCQLIFIETISSNKNWEAFELAQHEALKARNSFFTITTIFIQNSIKFSDRNLNFKYKFKMRKSSMLIICIILYLLQCTNNQFFPSIPMNNEIYDFARQRENFLTFTCDQKNNKLHVKAQTQFISYCGDIEPNRLITFDQIKKVLAAKNYQIISLDKQQIQISIAGVINLKLKNQDQLNFQYLRDAIGKLTVKVQKETEKNEKLESIVKDMQDQITTLTAQLNQLRSQFDEKSNQIVHKPVPDQPEFSKQSRIVRTKEEDVAIQKFFGNKTIKSARLLYRASENDFSATKFHQKCDGIPNTLTLILNQFNKTIGGFTPLKWSSPKYAELISDNSKESFIFSLTQNDKFTLLKPQSAIYNRQISGPSFGGGCDIYVHDQSNKGLQSYANIGYSYVNQKYQNRNGASMERFSGGNSFYFNTVEWQVWALEFI